MAQIDVTRMSVGEYMRVFGGEKTPIRADEVVVDVGSGMSDLSGLPVASVVQLDPCYEEIWNTETVAKLPLGLGERDRTTTELVAHVAKLEPDRVTVANTMRYVDRSKRVVALEQLLLLGRTGITQIYPIRSAAIETVIEQARRFGFGAFSQRVGLGGLRQITYGAIRLNNTLSIDEQPARVGPADRLKLARVLDASLL